MLNGNSITQQNTHYPVKKYKKLTSLQLLQATGRLLATNNLMKCRLVAVPSAENFDQSSPRNSLVFAQSFHKLKHTYQKLIYVIRY